MRDSDGLSALWAQARRGSNACVHRATAPEPEDSNSSASSSLGAAHQHVHRPAHPVDEDHASHIKNQTGSSSAGCGMDQLPCLSLLVCTSGCFDMGSVSRDAETLRHCAFSECRLTQRSRPNVAATAPGAPIGGWFRLDQPRRASEGLA